MALPITIPYTFAGSTGTAQLSQLDADLSYLATTINNIGNGTVPLGNVLVTGGAWQGGAVQPLYGGTGITTAPSNGQLLIGNGGIYSLGTLIAGSGVTITNAGGSITIASTGGGGGNATNITIGNTTITNGTSGRVLYDNSGVIGEIAPGNIGNVLTSSGSAWISQAAGGNSSIVVGTTPISNGANTYILYDNSGVVGNAPLSFPSLSSTVYVPGTTTTTTPSSNQTLCVTRTGTNTWGFSTQTVSTSAPSGGNAGDVWYRYA